MTIFVNQRTVIKLDSIFFFFIVKHRQAWDRKKYTTIVAIADDDGEEIEKTRQRLWGHQ